MEKSYYVYIVLCKDSSYYTGITNNIERRIWEHNNDEGEKHYTFSRRPVVLVHVEVYNDVNVAIEREKQIKGWSRKKKMAVIEENIDNLKKFSRRKYPNR